MTQRNISYFILSAVLAAIVTCILWDANWVVGDDFQFLKTTAIGKASRSWSGRGRFWPLGLVDYSVLLLVPYGYTVTAHFIYNSIIMIASVCLLFSFLLKITDKQYFISLFFILVLFAISSFMLVHITLIYPERIMFFILSIFMPCYWKAEQQQSTKYYLLAFLTAAYVTYTKEPIFGLIAIIALTNLLFGYKKITQKSRKFHYALLANSLIYLSIYVYRWFFRDTRKHRLYNNGKWLFSPDFDLISTINTQLNFEPFLYLLWSICTIRLFFVLIKKDREHLLLDGLLFAGIGYSISLICISMTSSYYIFPSIILALPSLAHWTSYFWKNKRKSMAIFIIAASLLLVKNTVVESYWTTTSILNCRKTQMPIVRAIAKAYQNGKEVIWLTSYSVNSYEGYISGIHASYDKNVEWEFEIYTYFLNYCLKIDPKKQTSILKSRNNLENISQNAIILCQEKDDKNALVESKGFRLVTKIYLTNIYAYDGLLEELR